MKKNILIIFLFFQIGSLFANDYYWELINSLMNRDFQTTERIINQNYNSMSSQEKRLVMGFVLTYSRGANTGNVVNLLASKNILPNSFDLYTAVNNGQDTAVVRLLMSYGAVPNGEILLLAMEKQRFDLALQFIQTGADVNYKYPLTSSYADGMTSLLYAVKWGNLEIARVLVERGADVNARAVDGSTALSLAETNGNNDLYNYLTEHGAVIASSDNSPANNSSAAQGTGVTGLLNDRTVSFQTGTYRLYGGSNSMRLSGTEISGSVSYVNVSNSRVLNGVYRVSANVLTISLEGYTFIYTINSNESFAGNGEVWMRLN